MRAKLSGGPFDGQEVELTDDAIVTNTIASDGGRYVATSLEPLTGPDGLRVAGGRIPVFEFIPDAEAES